MLRIASGIVTRRGVYATVLGGSASLTVAYSQKLHLQGHFGLVHQSGAICESALNSTVSSVCSQGHSDNQHDSPVIGTNLHQSSTELILPTIQATIRVARLVYTIIAMAAEYKVRPNLPHNPFTLQNDQSDELLTEIQQWKVNVQKFTDMLKQAQDQYTSPVPKDEHSESTKRQIVLERKKAVHDAANQLAYAEHVLHSLQQQGPSSPHTRAAQLLLDLCRANGGVYIKVGQHLANLDYILPVEYIQTLSSLFHDAPVSSFQSVQRVIQEELGASASTLFDDFSAEPIASASLAQVHTARDKKTGKKLAIKIQHEGLDKTSKGDLFALAVAVQTVEKLFPESFGSRWNWLVEEIAPNLPRELDFKNEGRNAERAAKDMKRFGFRDDECIVPKVHWKYTTKRVLCMDFEEGFKVTDISKIQEANLSPSEVAKLVASVFNSQVFLSGFVHCDPHPANVLLRPHPLNPRKPQVVLVDHGLYKTLSPDFRITYAKLWKALLLADITQIRATCEALGVTKMYQLLAAMLTSRPFDEILERSEKGGKLIPTKNRIEPVKRVRQDSINDADPSKANTASSADGDKVMIRGYAQRYLPEIIEMLDTVPREMLLLFKMNDCLRHIDYALKTPPTSSLVVSGRYAARALLESELASTPKTLIQKRNNSNQQLSRRPLKLLTSKLVSLMDFARVFMKIQVYEIYLWWHQVKLTSPYQFVFNK